MVLLLCVFVAQPALAQEGRVVEDTFHCVALEGNLLGDSPDRSVIVYLPPSYDENPDRRYPVVYLIHGTNVKNGDWIGKGNYRLFNIIPGVDRFMAAHPDREMIVVMPNGYHSYEACWYVNSPVTGNWEDFITQELVEYIDSTYRTFPEVAHRGLVGHSMGGTGTMNLAMRHPDVYGAMYAMSGAADLASHPPEEQSGTYKDEWIKTFFLTERDQFGARGTDPGLIALAAAYSPNPDNPPFFVDFPFDVVDGEIKRIDSVWQKWVVHDPVVGVDSHQSNLRRLGAIRLDCGTSDWLVDGNRVFSQALIDEGIPHVFEEYDGDHLNRVEERIETAVLPFFARVLMGDLPRVQSASVSLGTAVVGQPVSLEAAVVLGTPLAGIAQMSLGLSSVGLGSDPLMQHDGAGGYTVSSIVTPDQTGRYLVPVMFEAEDGERLPLVTVATLEVYPGEDMAIYADGPGPGWMVKASSKADSDPKSSVVAHSGTSAHAMTLKLPGEKVPGWVSYNVEDGDGVDWFGYMHLSFWIYPGDAEVQKLVVDATGRTKIDMVGDMGMDLSGDRWIEVQIPLKDLMTLPGGEVRGKMSYLKMSGTVTGTFYLDDVKLVAQEIEPGIITAVEESEGMVLPGGYALSQNYPNPFNPETTIRYALPEASAVRLSLYNTSGQMIRTLVDGAHPAGRYSVTWDGRDDAGREVASSVYLCWMEAGRYSAARKLLLVR